MNYLTGSPLTNSFVDYLMESSSYTNPEVDPAEIGEDLAVETEMTDNPHEAEVVDETEKALDATETPADANQSTTAANPSLVATPRRPRAPRVLKITPEARLIVKLRDKDQLSWPEVLQAYNHRTGSNLKTPAGMQHRYKLWKPRIDAERAAQAPPIVPKIEEEPQPEPQVYMFWTEKEDRTLVACCRAGIKMEDIVNDYIGEREFRDVEGRIMWLKNRGVNMRTIGHGWHTEFLSIYQHLTIEAQANASDSDVEVVGKPVRKGGSALRVAQFSV